jgi:membrane fusion protein, multidrug efflux system
MNRIVVACLLALAAPANAADQPLAAAPGLPPFAVHMAAVEDRKAVFATVETIRRTQARARIGGTVGQLLVSEGDQVKAGQTVALVGDPKLVLQLEANDQRMRSQEAQRDQSQIDWNRAQQLFQSGNIPKSQYDQARTNLQVAERGVAALKAERAVTGQQMAEGAVLAPVSGRVLEVPASLGAVVMPGETLVVIATENYVLRAALPERHARFIKPGDPVVVDGHEATEPLGLQNKTLFQQAPLAGTVKKVYPEIRDGRVLADIEASGVGEYFVGERVRIWVSTGTRQAMIVPAGYVYRRFGLDFVKLDTGDEVVIQRGQEAPAGVEVLSGLKGGDVVVAP